MRLTPGIDTLFFGDNLTILRNEIEDESVDLIYLDPPFNSNANYNVLFKSPAGDESQAQIEAFDDTWHWTDTAERAFDDVINSGNSDAAEMLRAMRAFLKENDMMAYLAMMAVRLIELHRVLKPTGSLYLHCDPTASHYLKLLLDAVFGGERFTNEIIWRRTGSHGGSRKWGSIHDTILFYSKSKNFCWNRVYQNYDESYLDKFYRFTDDRGRYRLVTLTGAGISKGDSGKIWRGVDPTTVGRHWAVPMKSLQSAYPSLDLTTYTTQEKLDLLDAAGLIYWPKKGQVPQQKRYSDENPGVPIQDIVDDISPISSQAAERLGYPTQKPVALLERIIKASSNEGDLVLDPFCGCGTTIHAAEKLNRKWIGIDITHLAIGLIRRRLIDAFPQCEFEVQGVPKDAGGARELAAQDKHQFQLWALSMIEAQPFKGGRKGADGGVDGYLYFKPDGKVTEKAVVSVKGGDHVDVKMIRDLIATVDRERAKLGVFLTLAKPTKPMIAEAAAAGFYESPMHGKFSKIQILTIDDIFENHRPEMPFRDSSVFKQAKREEGKTKQLGLDV
jgi:site-specific DNA-methyltransferase (adenine-specific)